MYTSLASVFRVSGLRSSQIWLVQQGSGSQTYRLQQGLRVWVAQARQAVYSENVTKREGEASRSTSDKDGKILSIDYAYHSQAIYSEDVSKRIGNEPVVQALKELMKFEMAMLVNDDDDDKGSSPTQSRSVHDNVSMQMLWHAGTIYPLVFGS